MIRVIGIDPGKTTGLVEIIDPGTGPVLDLHSRDFWWAYDYVVDCAPASIHAIVVEVSKSFHVWHKSAHRGSTRKATKHGQDVGGVRIQGELLAQRFTDLGYTVKTLPPRGKLKRNPLTKETANDQFQRITGHQGTSNPHTRDAGLLAWAEYRAIYCRRSHPNTALGA